PPPARAMLAPSPGEARSMPVHPRTVRPVRVLPVLLLCALVAGCASVPRSERGLARLGFSGDRSAELFARIGAEPTNARLHYDNGRYLLDRGRRGDLEVARVAFANAARLAPDWWQPRFALAITDYRLGSHRQALAGYVDAMGLRGGCDQLCYGLALVAWRAGEFGLAANALAEARRTGAPASDAARAAEAFVSAGLADGQGARPAAEVRGRLYPAPLPAEADHAAGNVSIDAYVIRQSRDSNSHAGINLLNALQLQFGGTLVNTYERDDDGATHATERNIEVTVPSVSYALNLASLARGSFSIEASPSVVAVPGSTSRFFEGSSVLIVPAGDETEPLERDVGVDLKVTPNEVGDGYVDLTAVLELSNLSANTVGGVNATVLQTEKTSAEATARIPFGRAIALGSGATMSVRDADSGTPGLSRIPGVAKLFGAEQSSARRSDVLVLITARRGVEPGAAEAPDGDALSQALFGRPAADIARISRLPSQAPKIAFEAWL